jgi:hypothetical protein
VGLALGGLIAAGCGRGDETNTRAEPVGEQPAAGAAVDAAGYAWVSDGRVVAVRRGPVTDRAYGAHGVDYSPGTSCDAARGR